MQVLASYSVHNLEPSSYLETPGMRVSFHSLFSWTAIRSQLLTSKVANVTPKRTARLFSNWPQASVFGLNLLCCQLFSMSSFCACSSCKTEVRLQLCAEDSFGWLEYVGMQVQPVLFGWKWRCLVLGAFWFHSGVTVIICAAWYLMLPLTVRWGHCSFNRSGRVQQHQHSPPAAGSESSPRVGSQSNSRQLGKQCAYRPIEGIVKILLPAASTAY